MAIREEVLVGLESCADRTRKSCRYCPYDITNVHCISDMATDALELLKQQQETITSFENTINKLNMTVQEQEIKIKGLSTLLDFAHAAISHRKKCTDDRPE